jgi:N-methylhydantoinase B
VLSEKNVIPPYGVSGGSNGASNRFTVVRDGKTVEPSTMPGKVSGFPLRTGDIVREETAGGGGFGDPLEREPARVAADVAAGYLTRDQAARRYGVAIGSDGAVDASATAARRKSLREARHTVRLIGANEELFDGPRRVFRLSASLARRLGIGDHDLVEVLTGAGAPLRAWAAIDAPDGVDGVIVGPSALGILKAGPGAAVEIRAVRSTPEL